jgi:two-component system phosphate regulon response regulator OmpR
MDKDTPHWDSAMKETGHILVVDDQKEICEVVQQYLASEGYRVSVANDGAGMRRVMAQGPVDLVILDLMLPGEDGLTLARELREQSSVGIIILTGRGETVDRIIGLEMGADDYLPKPFEPRELLARLRAILRRGKGKPGNNVLRFGRLEIDRGAREIRLDGEIRALTSHQFGLLLVLAEHAGRVMSREALMEILKAEPLDAFDRSIDVHISRIRAAIEDDAKKPRRIVTVRGAGYVFAKAQD